jgi:formylglycine-generating enzyme required for sulfatase activity
MVAVAATLAALAGVFIYRDRISTFVNRGELPGLPLVTPATPQRDTALSVTPGSSEGFRDLKADGQPCPFCPELTVVPGGSFMMGSPDGEPGQEAASESPQRKVTIARPFAVGKFAITRAEFEAFVTSTKDVTTDCSSSFDGKKVVPDRSWRKPGFAQDGSHPVVCVLWNDAIRYVKWLSMITGRTYRLLSDAEREYVTRAGTTTPFWWGSSIKPTEANYLSTEVYAGGGSKGDPIYHTMRVDSFTPNPWGLYNVHGNVWDWLQDCWIEKLADNPGDGTAREAVDCSWRVQRGGGWFSFPRFLRSARRDPGDVNIAYDVSGFRVGRDLAP